MAGVIKAVPPLPPRPITPITLPRSCSLLRKAVRATDILLTASARDSSPNFCTLRLGFGWQVSTLVADISASASLLVTLHPTSTVRQATPAERILSATKASSCPVQSHHNDRTPLLLTIKRKHHCTRNSATPLLSAVATASTNGPPSAGSREALGAMTDAADDGVYDHSTLGISGDVLGRHIRVQSWRCGTTRGGAASRLLALESDTLSCAARRRDRARPRGEDAAAAAAAAAASLAHVAAICCNISVVRRNDMPAARGPAASVHGRMDESSYRMRNVFFEVEAPVLRVRIPLRWIGGGPP
eukprot:scaffold307_cov390-Prasinococcus_capsulatus_cf.AAC.38